jgi:serine/threonine-protein kinase
VLDDALGAQTSFRERFFRESRLASALDHPNIVAIHDAGEHEGALYIAMRYVEGTDLRAAIAARSSLDPRQAVAIITQVAAGLDAAHAAGVVHRDVKPANVLLSTDLTRAYLADFGLTKQLASETSALSSVGQFLGTFAYAAPEQLEGREVDGRTDQYALGCTLFECLTGRIPFDGASHAVLAAHLSKPPPPVTGLCPWLPPAIDAVVARAMAKSPDARYYNCGEMAAAAANALLADSASIRDSGRRRGHQRRDRHAENGRQESRPTARLETAAASTTRGTRDTRRTLAAADARASPSLAGPGRSRRRPSGDRDPGGGAGERRRILEEPDHDDAGRHDGQCRIPKR